jgi:hypothetical protein
MLLLFLSLSHIDSICCCSISVASYQLPLITPITVVVVVVAAAPLVASIAVLVVVVVVVVAAAASAAAATNAIT